jgi:hypothetical protein
MKSGGDRSEQGESHIQAEERNCHTQVSEVGTSYQGSGSVVSVKVSMVSRVLRVRCNVDHSVMLGVIRAVSRYRD